MLDFLKKSNRLKGCGHYLPQRILTNQELEKKVETTDAWIRKRTGIQQRHIAEKHETTAFMAFKAAEEALSHAKATPEDVEAIILATSTPDHSFPATATKVQHLLGAARAFAFDINAACSGFVYGLSLVETISVKNVLLIGAERMSSLVDWNDRTTCVLFGDGAGAFFLEAASTNKSASFLGTDGSGYEKLLVSPHIQMEGKEVFKQAVLNMSKSIHHMTGNNLCDIDWIIPHQANQRIIDTIISGLNVPEEKVISTIQWHANTSSASIPLAFHHAHKTGKIKENQSVLTTSFGAGFTWGASCFRT